MQPAPPQPLSYGTPGVVTAFRIFTGFCAAFALFMALFGLIKVTGWDYKLGLRPEGDTEPVDESDWGVVVFLLAVGIFMLACAFIQAKPSSWGVGLAVLILGLPCCLVPSVVLLIFWCQTPTRLYFLSHGWKTLPPPMQPPPPPPPTVG